MSGGTRRHTCPRTSATDGFSPCQVIRFNADYFYGPPGTLSSGFVYDQWLWTIFHCRSICA